MRTTVVKTVQRLHRLNNSVNGNPRYRVFFTDGTDAVTSSDAGFAYGIDNPEMRGPVSVEYTRSGRIAHMAPAPAGGTSYPVEFLPATGPDEYPCVRVAGVLVFAYVDDEGTVNVTVDTETAEPGHGLIVRLNAGELFASE